MFGQECQTCGANGEKYVDDESLEICTAKLAKYALGILGYRYDRVQPLEPSVETPPHKSELCGACKAGMCVDSITQKMGRMRFH